MTALLALLLLQPPVAAGEPPLGRFDDRVEVSEVVVHAVVTDRRGRQVVGLEPADFVVRENGELVEVTSAAYYPQGALRAAELEVPVPGLPRLRAAGRTFIFLFHDLRLGDRESLGVLSHQLRAGRDARRWVREELAADDLVAVAGYDFRLRIHQDFTGDPAAIERAISRASARESEEERPAAPGAPSLLDGLPGFRERRQRSARLRGALGLLAEAVRELPGRKHLLLFSVGIGLAGHERGVLGPRDVPTLVEQLNDSELAVYCLDTTPPEVEHALADTLNLLAEATGGQYFGHIARFQAPLRRIDRRLQGYYLLTYVSTHAGAEFRRLEVATRSRELVVAARRGYLAR